MKVTAVYGWCRMESSGYSNNVCSIVAVTAPTLLAAIEDCGKQIALLWEKSNAPHFQLEAVEGELILQTRHWADYWYDEKSYHKKSEVYILAEDGEKIWLDIDPARLAHLDLREIILGDD